MGVHLYTASGTVVAFLYVVAVLNGEIIRALWFGLIAVVIDGSDGMLARRFAVKETAPRFDGAQMDSIVDYITYVFAPMVLLWAGGYLPAGPLGMVLVALPLLVSVFQFCWAGAKTDDHFFRGFPSYWNVVAFYAVIMDLAPATVGAVLLLCTVLVFVPITYLYPSQSPVARRWNIGLGAAWMASYAVLLLQWPRPDPFVLALSLGYVVYYVGVSIRMTLRPSGGSGGAAAPASSSTVG
jgi:phosphatidylcholine synthase